MHRHMRRLVNACMCAYPACLLLEFGFRSEAAVLEGSKGARCV